MVRDALGVFRAVVVNGPRQSGKTTLVRDLLGPDIVYRTLDEESVRDVAGHDPHGLVDADGLLVLDEFQRGGDPLLLAIKARLDRSDSRGQMLLSGSANFLASRRLSETLAGRIGLVQVLPLSQGEVRGTGDGLVASLREGIEPLARLAPTVVGPREQVRAIVRGGYPEVVRHMPPGREVTWFDSYVRTVIEREGPTIGRIGDLDVLRRVLVGLAGTTGRELNVSAMADRLGVARPTLVNHLQILEALFLVSRLPAWTPEPIGRLTKSPKIHLVDSGLAAALLGWSEDRVADPTWTAAGQLWETFVVGELRKQCSWQQPAPFLFHARDKGGRHEVDVVLEWPDGSVAGVEVKRSRSVRRSDANGLRWLRDRVGDRFRAGTVVYGGEEVVPLSGDLIALPLSALWQ